MIPIEDEQQLKNNIIYVARNPYEKQYAVPGGYLWGSGYLFQSMVAERLLGERVGNLSRRTVQRMTGSLVRIPDHWQIHPEIGILPISFITLSKHIKLFPSPKDYSTALVKDYESLVRIASRLEDDLTFDKKEAEDMTNRLLEELFGGRKLRYLSMEEKYRLARVLRERFRLSPQLIGHVAFLPDPIVKQVLSSKDYGVRIKESY